MLNSILLALVSAVFVLGGASLENVNSHTVKEERDAHIIVQFDGVTNGVTRESVLANQNRILREISATVTSNYKVTDRLTNVTSAVIMDVPSSYVGSIRSFNGVSDVNYNKIHEATYQDGESEEITLRKSVLSAVHTASDNASAETMNKPSGTKEGEGVLVAVLDNGFYLEHEAFTALDASVSVKSTQASLLPIISASGFHGKPDADHSCYYNNKVPFYYDYGGSTTVHSQAGTPDYDVFDEEEAHGTHVASIIGANGPYKGIAPKVQLALMKVFTEYTPTEADKKEGYTAGSGAYDTSILLALEDAAKIGADIVNMSLGSDLDDFDGQSIVQSTIRSMRTNGISVNVAAGNSGKGMYSLTGYANWSTDQVETGILSSYANNEGSTTVSAAQPVWQFYDECLLVGDSNVSFSDQVVNYTSSSGKVTYTPERHLTDIVSGSQNEFGWVKVPNYGATEDYEGLNISGKIAVIDRGDLTFTAKVYNAVSKGAIAVLIINNDASETDFTFRMDFSGYTPEVPVATLLYRDRTIFTASGSGTLKLLVDTYADTPTAKQVCSFTSDGATYDLSLKPEISAPGEAIKGAVIFQGSGDSAVKSPSAYDYYSGTSMATPNYCGAEALLLSEHLGSGLSAYHKTLAARTMSTTDPMKDAYGSEYSSVRIQGAGMMDISGALNSKVYLEGLASDGTTGLGKAKVQLFNNDDIKNGTLNLSFLAHNESSSSVKYTAKTYIYHPSLSSYNSESYAELTGEYASILDTLIDTVSQSVTIPAGDSTVALNSYSLSKSMKSYLNSKFANGCSIEGFVVLTPESNSEEVINIPYYGFYGDYASASPVEPFTFEREEGKVYQSDLVNNLAHSGLSLPNADFRSGWVSGYFKDMDSVSMESTILNTSSIFGLKDSNRNVVTLAGTNPATGKVDPNYMYFSNGGGSNTMIIQQFVTRSVSTNTITLTNKTSGKAVLIDHMFDSLFGSSEEGEENYSLFKSTVSADYLSNNIIAHRAYTIIPMYDPDSKALFADGEYTMDFDYTLAGSSQHYTMRYTINLDSGKPTAKSVEHVKIWGQDYTRIRYNSSIISTAAVNGNSYKVKRDKNGSYVDVKTSDLGVDLKLYAAAVNLAYAEGNVLTYANDDYHIGIKHEDLAMSYAFTTEIEDNASSESLIDRSFEITVKKKSTVKILEGGFEVTIKLTNGLDPETLKVFDTASGSESEVTDVEIYDSYATFHTAEGSFRLTSSKVKNPASSIDVTNYSPLVWSLAVGIPVLAGAALLTVYLVLKKRKKVTSSEK